MTFRNSSLAKVVSVVIACMFLMNTITWSVPENYNNLGVQSIFSPLDGTQRRDIGIGKYLISALAKTTQNFVSIKGDAHKTIGTEKIDVTLEFSKRDLFKNRAELGLRENEEIIPYIIKERGRKVTYYAYVSLQGTNVPRITVFTEEEFGQLKKALHGRRELLVEQDISHQAEVDTPLTIVHGAKDGIRFLSEEAKGGAKLAVREFFTAFAATPEFIAEAEAFIDGDNIAFVPDTSSIDIDGVDTPIEVVIDKPHVSNLHMNIPESIRDAIPIIIHELAAKAGLRHTLNESVVENGYRAWASNEKDVTKVAEAEELRGLLPTMRFVDLTLREGRDLHAQPNTKPIDDAIAKANTDPGDIEAKIARLEQADYLLRLMPLMVDVLRETGKDERVLETLAALTGKNAKTDADELRLISYDITEGQWQALYGALAEAYLELGDTWRAISAYNAMLHHSDKQPDEVLEKLADLYSEAFSIPSWKVHIKKSLVKPEFLKGVGAGSSVKNKLIKIAAYHDMMTRGAAYTAARRPLGKDKGVKSFTETFGFETFSEAGKLIAELTDKLNDVPRDNGFMKPFAGAEILDNPYEITTRIKHDGPKATIDENIVYTDTKEIKFGDAVLENTNKIREGDVARRLDIMGNKQWFAYRTYDFRAAFKTTILELPGTEEKYEALISEKLIFWSAIELGRTMLEGLGLKDPELAQRVKDDPKLAAKLRSKVYALVSGGCRLPIQEHRDAFALGLLYSGVNVFLVKSNPEGRKRALGWIEEDIKAGRMREEDAERFREIEEQFEASGIISTPMYYLIVNLLWNDGMRVGDGREDLFEAYQEAAYLKDGYLLLGGGHGTASHNPWEFSGWKQMLSWFSVVLNEATGVESTVPQVLSINDAEMQGLKEGIIAGRTRPVLPEELQGKQLETVSSVEVSYIYYLYSTAYIRLGRDVWGWLWNRSLREKGGVRRLIMATRDIKWDNTWDLITGEFATKLGFSPKETADFKTLFDEKPLLAKAKPLEGLPKLGLGYQHGSSGLGQLIFRALGQEVVVVHDDPDPLFPDGEPYPNIPWFVRRAMAQFEREGVEIAIIGDEDGDRQICWLPQQGKMVQGDELMGLRAMTIAKQEVERAKRQGLRHTRRTMFYCEVKFYRGLQRLVEEMKAEYLEEEGIILHMDVYEGPVGFGYVKDEMTQTESGILRGLDEIEPLPGRGLVANLRHDARIGGGAEVSGHGMEPLSRAEMSEVEIADKVLTPMIMGNKSIDAFYDAYNRLPKSFASPEVRVGTNADFGRYEKDAVVQRVLQKFLNIAEKKWGLKYSGTRRQYTETGTDGKPVEYGALYHVYKSEKPVDVKIGGITLHNVELWIDKIDGAKYYLKSDEGENFMFFLNRKSNTQNEIITRVDGDNVEIRNALATFFYGLYEEVKAKDLLTDEARKDGEAAVLLNRDLWVLYEVLPRLAYEKLPEDIQADLDNLAEEQYLKIQHALADGTLIDGLDVFNRDRLGYFYSFKGERAEGFERIKHWAEKTLNSNNPYLVSEEQDLGELVDTFLGNSLGEDRELVISLAYDRSVKRKVSRYNTASSYGWAEYEKYTNRFHDVYEKDKRLGLSVLAARYVNRRVKDFLMQADVARLRKKDDLPNIEPGRKLLFNAQYIFEVVEKAEDMDEGIYLARYIDTGGKAPMRVSREPGKIDSPMVKDGDYVYISQYPDSYGIRSPGASIRVARIEAEVVIHDPNAILDDRHTGLIVTKTKDTKHLGTIDRIKRRGEKIANALGTAVNDLVLSLESGEQILYALDTDLGKDGTRKFIRQLIKAIRDTLGDRQDIDTLLRNLIILTGQGENIAADISRYVSKDGKDGIKIKKSNVIMVTKSDNQENCGNFEGEATITYVDDSEIRTFDYYPFVELALFTLAKALYHRGVGEYDADKLKKLYKTLWAKEVLEDMIIPLFVDKNAVIISLRRVRAYNYNELEEIYEKSILKFLRAA